MAAIKQLAAVTRSGTGKGAARSVRREGRVPGVIYGGGEKPEPISVEFKELNKLIYAGHFLTTIFELDIGGRKERVLPRDYQLDVVTDKPMHVDFLRLRAGSRVRIGVPVHVVNREASPGVKKGGTVNLVLHTLELLAPGGRDPRGDHGRSHRPRLPRFGARLRDQAAGGLPSRGHEGGLHGRDDRAADRLPGRDAGRRDSAAAPAAAAAAPAKGAAAAPAKGAAAAPAKGAAPAKAAARQARREEVSRSRFGLRPARVPSRAGLFQDGCPRS